MHYGFAIDQRTCIGCHACTVACKTEHEVPVGQFRTWVKYVDSGSLPRHQRDFGVMRCNHCTDAPCVTICPTQALFKREDGIVDFDNDRCIGCKSCMQACPYDAIYIDEDTHTAAKCNFCAHRVDEGLEPACVVVCPTHSIWVGDLDDPDRGISKLVSTNDTAVRAPEQNTGPNVFYLGADRAVLDPLAAPVDETYIWAKPDAHRAGDPGDLAPDPTTNDRTTLNTAHPRPWGWRVTTYLWTKGVGAGALALALLAHLIGLDLGVLGEVVAPVLGFAGAAVDRPPPGVGPQASRPLLLPVHQAPVVLVAGARRPGAERLRRRVGPVGPGRALAGARRCGARLGRHPGRGASWPATRPSSSARPRDVTCGSPRCCSGTCSPRPHGRRGCARDRRPALRRPRVTAAGGLLAAPFFTSGRS